MQDCCAPIFGSIAFYKLCDDKANATFKLYEAVEEGEELGEPLFTFTTGTDGAFPDDFELDVGNYVLYETEAPDGYSLPEKPITLKITHVDGTYDDDCTYTPGVTTVSAMMGVTNLAVASETTSEGKLKFTITVPNSTGYELPSTGGSGTTLDYALGVLLISIDRLLNPLYVHVL